MSRKRFDEILNQHDLVLMEAAVIEALRHEFKAVLDPQLLNAPLVYDPDGRRMITRLYERFMTAVSLYQHPLLVCSPTWRANRDRVADAQSWLSASVNREAVEFIQTLCAAETRIPVLVGGLMGCKNDCYQPRQCLSTDEAAEFHQWQARDLAAANPDFLMAATLPGLSESVGLALAMQSTGLPFLISFVIGRDGCLLDGNSLDEAIQTIDQHTRTRPPFGYMVNCSYPSFLDRPQMTLTTRERLIGFQANASSMSHDELDNNPTLQKDDPRDWIDHMRRLHHDWGIKILGGCCGTNASYLENLARIRLSKNS